MNLFEQMMREHGKLKFDTEVEKVEDRKDSIDPEKASKTSTQILNERNVRHYTNKIYELINEGVIDCEWLAKSLLTWLSEDEVEEFARAYEILDELDDEEVDDSIIESINKKVRGKLAEDLKLLSDLGDYKPWSGAVSTWDKIVEEGKVDQLDFELEMIYPDGLTVTELNDILWFEPEWVFELLGISDEDDDDLNEACKGKKRSKNKKRIKESVNAKLVYEVAKFLKNSVEELKSDPKSGGCCTYKLDNILAVCVGWTDGYDSNDDTVIHDPDNPTWVIAAAIKVWTSDDLRTDFDWIYMPYFEIEEIDGEVWDTSVSISPKENYKALAEWFVGQYEEMSKYEITEQGAIVDQYGERTYKVVNIVWDNYGGNENSLPEEYQVTIEVDPDDDYEDIQAKLAYALEDEFPNAEVLELDFNKLEESLKNKKKVKESVDNDKKVYILLDSIGVDSVFSEDPSLDIKVLYLKDITDETYNELLKRSDYFSRDDFLTDMPFRIVTDIDESCKGNKKLKESEERKYLTVCDHCLAGIESHEGPQITKTIYVDDEEWFDSPEEYERESKCDWCEEYGFDTLYEIHGSGDGDLDESLKNKKDNKKLKEGKETSYKGYKIVDTREPGDMSYVDAEYLEPTCFIYKGNRCVGNAYDVTDAKHKIDQNKSWNPVLDPALPADMKLAEDTVKKSNGKWTNRGDDGEEHGEFKTKKKADAQRKAMYANGYKGESKKKVTERNLTRSERHNRNMDRIFNTKKEQDKKFADFLRKNGYLEDEIKSLEDADKLNAEIYDKFGGSKAIGDILKESSEYKTIAKLSNGLEVVSYPYGYAISDGYTNDRLTVRGDTFVMDDGRFKLSDKDKDKINNLIKKKEITESIDDSDCYTYKNYTICNDPKRGLWTIKELEGETFSTDTDAEERIDSMLDESRNLKEKTYYDHNLGVDVGEFQEWVDYDMERYGRISVETRRKLRNAGLTLVRDQYGDYEVISDEPIHNRRNKYDKRRYDDELDEAVDEPVDKKNKGLGLKFI